MKQLKNWAQTLQILVAVTTMVATLGINSASAADTDNLSVAGAAIHSEFRKDYYLGVLYSSDSAGSVSDLLNTDIAHRIDMLITYKSLSSRRFARIWSTRIAINNMAQTDQLQAMSDQVVGFTSVIKDRVFEGDRVSIANSPEADALIVSVNGVELNRFNRDLYPMLLRAWIGNTPPSTEFKQGMLSKGDIAPQIVDQIQAWVTTDEQVARIEGWAGPSAEELAEAQRIAEAEAEALRLAEEKAKSDKAAAAKLAAQRLAAKKRKDAAKVAAQQLLLAEDDEDEELLDAADEFASQLYRTQLLKWTYKYITYPSRALDRRHEGTVTYAVTIDRNGNVISASEKEGSRYASLNRETERAIKRSEPYPAVPDDITGEQFTFDMPVVFKLPD